MVTLKRIGVMSAGRVGFFFGLTTSVMSVVFAITWAVIFDNLPLEVLTPELLAFIGRNILIGSFATSLGFGFFAFVYNMGFGNLQIEFEMPDTPDDKPKNGDHKERIEIE